MWGGEGSFRWKREKEAPWSLASRSFPARPGTWIAEGRRPPTTGSPDRPDWGSLEGIKRSGLGLRCACQLHPPGWPAAIFRYGGRHGSPLIGLKLCLCASRGLGACVERASGQFHADRLHGARIDLEPFRDLAHALGAARRLKSLLDSFLELRGYRRPVKPFALSAGPLKPGADSFLNDRSLELGKDAQHLEHGLAGGVVVSSPC